MLALIQFPMQLAEAATQATDPWASTFLGLDSDKRFILMIVGIGCIMAAVIATVGILSGVADQFHRRRMEAEMKRELLDRGLSVDEVATVIRAAPESAMGRWFFSGRRCGKN
jgi:hypothetical protein